MTASKKIKIIETDISDLTPDPQNPRKRTTLSAGVIQRSLEQFGACRSIVVDENGIVRAGNGTPEEAGQLGIEKVIVIETTGNELVAVKRSGLTEEQWKKYAIADNTASDFSTWDAEVLAEIAEQVDLDEFFPADKMEEILSSLGQQQPSFTEEEEDEDELADILDNVGKVESRVKPNEIWALGRHRIAACDSTVEKNVRALLGDQKCQMCWTDPPYNVDYDPERRHSTFSKERLANPIGKIANDSMSDDNFFDFLIKAYSGIDLALSEGSPIYISHADTMGHHFRNAFLAMPWKMQSCLIWKKTVLVFGRADYHWMHEPILYGWKEGGSHKYYGDRKQTTILEFPSPHYDKENCDTDGYVHSCQKPVPLISYCIENSTQSGDNIYDPFLGSGSTLVAAEKMEGDRTVFGFELSEAYCETIIQRFFNLTGIEPKLVGRIPD